MFLRDAFHFWFRPMFGFNIEVGTAMALSGGLNFLGGLFSSSSQRKAQKAQNALQRAQLEMEKQRRAKLLGLADSATEQALRRYRNAPTYDELFAAGTGVQERLSGANEARLSFVDDILSGEQLTDRLSGYAPLGSAILDAGLAERNAIEEAYAQVARERNMEQVNKYGGGGFAADIAASRDLATNMAGANLAFANAVRDNQENIFNIRESDLGKRAQGAAMLDDVAKRATLFDVLPEQLAFSTDLANLSDAYNTAGTMLAPYSFYAGLPATNYQLNTTGTSPVGDALGNAAQGFADYGTYKLTEQRNSMYDDYLKSMSKGGGSGMSGGLESPDLMSTVDMNNLFGE